MINTEDKDPFLANLLKQSTMEEPSADFNSRIMAIIKPTEAAVTKIPFFSQHKYWLIAAISIITAIAATVFFPSFIGHQQLESLHKFFNPYINLFSSVSSLLKSQPIISIVVLAIGGLLIIDKLFSRVFRTNVQYTL